MRIKYKAIREEVYGQFERAEEERRKNYELQEAANRNEFQEADAARREVLVQAQEGSASAMGLILEAALPLRDLPQPPDTVDAAPLDHKAAYGIIDASAVHLKIELPPENV